MSIINQNITRVLKQKPHNPLDMVSNAIEFNCIIFVGDPHLTSRQISSRNDLESTMNSFLKKMEYIAQLSHEHKALVLIKGDLLDNDKESNIKLLNEISRIFSLFYFPPYTLIGNHDKTETILNKNNMLKYLIDTYQVFEILDNEITIKTIINGVQVEIGGTHYGSKIPKKVNKKSKATNKVIWMTHHDLYFGMGYENMQKLHEIEGVDLAVNGHIHSFQNEIQHGYTTWCNAGNITRLTRDMDEHIPRVWYWTPQQHDNETMKLKGIEIPHQKNIFKKAIEIQATQKDELLLTKQTDYHRLQFTNAALSFADSNNATSDKEVVKFAIANMAESMNLPSDFIEEMNSLLEEAVNNTE